MSRLRNPFASTEPQGRLAAYVVPDERSDALRKVGGLLIGTGLFMLYARKSGGTLGEAWGDFALFLVLLADFAFLYGFGVVGRLGTGHARPWSSVYLVFGALLLPFVLAQLVKVLNGDPGAPLNVAWIFVVTGALAALAALAGTRYGWFLAGLAAIVAWSGLWSAILSGDLTDHYGAYRGLLIVVAAMLVGAAWLLYRADRVANARAAGELLTGAAISAVLAGAISFTAFFGSSIFTPVATADSSVLWEIELLVVSLLAVGVGSRFGARGPAYVGAFGLLAFLLIAGADINDSSPSGSTFGWPAILVALGALALAGSVAEQLGFPLPGPGSRPEDPEPGRRSTEVAPPSPRDPPPRF